MKKPIFRVFSSNHGWMEYNNVKILPDNYIQCGNNEPCPIEDYGDYELIWKDDETEK